ncbi:MAG: phosphoglycerate kinase [Patescibacteria group bacterium]
MENFNLPLLSDLPTEELTGRQVILRLDLNVPITAGKVRDDFRLKKILPTINYLRQAGARVMAISHLGREEESLQPVADYFKNFFPTEFIPTRAVAAELVAAAPANTVLLLENLRRETGEETNDPNFAGELAKLGDLFVNEAFASSHRAHASIVGLPHHLPSFAGFVFADEIKNLSRVFQPARPFTVILGGAKFETKLPVVKKLISLADQLFIYGALAHAFFKELGYELGESLVDHNTAPARPFLYHPKIILPVDVRVKNGEQVFIKRPEHLIPTDNILDVGLVSIEKLLPVIAESRFILWNGPLGNFEQGFKGSTETAAKFISGSNATTIVGGGDTIAAIRVLNLLDQFDFVSTGGGAMLDFIANGTLPGIEALLLTKT